MTLARSGFAAFSACRQVACRPGKAREPANTSLVGTMHSIVHSILHQASVGSALA